MATLPMSAILDTKVELLKWELRGTSEDADPEAMQEANEVGAREAVDADPGWGSWTALAERTMAEGEQHHASIQREKERLNKKAFHEWKHEADERFAGTLLDANAGAEKIAGGITGRFPVLAIPVPLTTVDALNTDLRMRVFSEATPEEARNLVRDAIQREDFAFLAAVRTLLRSWPGHRNAWSSPDGRTTARELLEEIEGETPDLVRLTGEYAAEKLEAFRNAWRYLLNNLLNGDGVIDPVNRTLGALSPLLEPEG